MYICLSLSSPCDSYLSVNLLRYSILNTIEILVLTSWIPASKNFSFQKWFFFFSDNLRHQKSEGCLRLVLLFYWNLWRLSRYLGRVHGMFFERHDGLLFALFLSRFILLESTAFTKCMLHYVRRNEGWFSVCGSKSCALFRKAVAEFTRGFWSISRSFVIQQNEEERGCQQSWFFGSK